MSLAAIKAKEEKGKKKVLPKLKTILANPSKTICPVLDEQELKHLKILLEKGIGESNLEPRCFATAKGICLGLESSLRKINNQTSSCVFISLSIKPSHIISLIARNAQTKDETQPVYAQPKLEHFIQEIFGVQALCMVFPKDLKSISGSIDEWVEKRKKPARINKELEQVKKSVRKQINKAEIKKPDIIQQSNQKLENVSNPDIIQKSNQKLENAPKTMSGDFISLGNDKRGMDNFKLDRDEALEALSEIIDKIPTSSKAMPKIAKKRKHKELESDKDLQTNNRNAVMKVVDDSESDDFLNEYKTLTVHKIKGNPNKNPKKKRKKNKKKVPVN